MYNVVELYDRRRQNRATVELVPVHASAQNVYANWIELLRYIKINVFSCISYYLVTLAGSALLLKNKIQYSSLGVFSKTTKYKTAELNAYELNSDSFHKSYLNKKNKSMSETKKVDIFFVYRLLIFLCRIFLLV